MKLLLFLLLTVASFSLHAQFAVVEDRDGYVNIRAAAKSNSNISDTLHNGHVVWCFDPEGTWLPVDYEKNGEVESGYIYKDRVKWLSSMAKLPARRINTEQVRHRKDSIEIIVSTTAFVPANNRLQYQMNSGSRYLAKINGSPFWGTDGEIPRKQYKFISIKIGTNLFDLPASALANLFEPNLEISECYFEHDKSILYISGMNSDGAGGYVVLWIIEKGHYRGRFVTNGF